MKAYRLWAGGRVVLGVYATSIEQAFDIAIALGIYTVLCNPVHRTEQGPNGKPVF
jgi:hypothetical protein